MGEAYEHPHNVARGSFVEIAGKMQPAPAPRFSRTVPKIERPPAHPGQHTDEALRDWGFSDADLRSLRDAKAVA
jgi:alpha-methylacyl-CoA racemase